MVGELRELLKSFSFRTTIKSNIISNSGSMSSMTSSVALSGSRSSSPSDALVSTKSLRKYYLITQEIRDYEVNELTNTIVGIFKDYLVNYLNKESNIVIFKSKELKAHQDKINKIFKDLDIVKLVKDNLDDIIYYGSYCVKLIWNEVDRKYEIIELANPTNVVTIENKGVEKSHLVVSKKGTIYEVSPNSILRFGKASLRLFNDMNESYFDKPEEDTLVNDFKISGGYPLYYNLTNKVKEYLLKDQIVSFLSIKDLIQPLLLLIRVDKNTSGDEANRLALNTENLINKYSDISAILGSNFSINDLLDALINNIRVLPDYGSALGDMNSVDLSKISNKIQEIRSDQDNSRENILTSIGIPRVLFSGDSTKWDAIKSSERLNSKITGFISRLNDSIKLIASKFYYMNTGKELSQEEIIVNLFNKTQVEYNSAISNADIISNLINSINSLLDSTQNIISQSKIIDPDAYVAYVTEQLKMIDPEAVKLVSDKNVKTMIDEVIKSRNQDESPLTSFRY